MNNTPYRQNDFDGLCSMMSVINSFKYLCPEVFVCEKNVEKYVSTMVKSLDSNTFQSLWLNGGEIRKVLHFLKFSQEYFKKHFDINIVYEFPCKGNFSYTNSQEMFEMLRKNFGKCACCIIGFSEPDPHWTVIKNIKSDEIIHFDSWEYKTTKISETNLIKRNEKIENNFWNFCDKDVVFVYKHIDK